LRFLGVAHAVHQQALAHALADRHARVERGIRVLEDDLHVATQRFELAAVQLEHVLALEEHPAAGGRRQAQDGAAHGGLAAARFAHQAERLPFPDHE